MDSGKQDQPGIIVPERFVPVPTTGSAQAQAFLACSSPFGEQTAPDMKDKAAWREYVDQINMGIVAFLQRDVEAYPARVSTHTHLAAPIYELTPDSLSPANKDRAILYIHAGGFVMGGGLAASHAAHSIASVARMRTFSVDYRMPPEFPFPASLDDCVAAYKELLGEQALFIQEHLCAA